MSTGTRRFNRRGVAAVLAMLFLAIISTIAIAMMGLTRTNSQIAMNQDGVERARANAETGMRWIAWKFATVTMPQTVTGTINDAAATALWPTIISQIMTDPNAGLNSMSASIIPTKETTYDSYGHPQLHVVVSIPSTTASPHPMDFEILATSGPTAPPWADGAKSYTDKAQVIGVQSKGIIWADAAKTTPRVTRIIKGYFLMQKTFRYGVLSRIPIQLGKNTVVEGDVYMAHALDSSVYSNSVPPVLSVSDFRYTSGTTSDALTAKIQAYEDFLKSKSGGYTGLDNRIDASDSSMLNKLRASNAALANVGDYSGDGHVDEYDILLAHFDLNGDHKVNASEYATAAPKDPNLFGLIDAHISSPLTYRDSNGNLVTETPRAGYNDGYLDNLDPYAKVKGTVRIWETRDALTARLGNSAISDLMQGALVSADGYSPAVLFGQNDTSDPATQISAANFKMGAFLDLAGGNVTGTVAHPSQPANPDTLGTYLNTTVTTADGNGTADAALINTLKSAPGSSNPVTVTKTVNGKSVTVLTDITEPIPYGSSNPRNYARRKVYTDQNFKNCVIGRGTNALFINCTFDGVTFVDGAYNMSDSSSSTYANGNMLRFQGCTFTGPVAQGDALSPTYRGQAPTNCTISTNTWEFTGATTFDLDRQSVAHPEQDGAALATIKEQATIMAPQTNIEMGSFTQPGAATCSFKGVVVGAVVDVRGVADIDGTIISTAYRGVADNCTLGYFGSNDSATNQGQPDPSLVNGSYGRIRIRYNPLRTLPDGINLNVSIYPDTRSMGEVTQWQAN